MPFPDSLLDDPRPQEWPHIGADAESGERADTKHCSMTERTGHCRITTRTVQSSPTDTTIVSFTIVRFTTSPTGSSLMRLGGLGRAAAMVRRHVHTQSNRRQKGYTVATVGKVQLGIGCADREQCFRSYKSPFDVGRRPIRLGACGGHTPQPHELIHERVLPVPAKQAREASDPVDDHGVGECGESLVPQSRRS
jgi:hypothetical protein